MKMIHPVNLNSFKLFILLFSSLLIKSSLCRHLNKDSFNTLVGSDKHLLIKFYAPWCKHCVALEPTWKALTNIVKSDPSGASKLVVARVDCTQEGDLCNEEGITGYPSIKMYNSGDRQGTEYEGPKDLKSLLELLNKLYDLSIEEQKIQTVIDSVKNDLDTNQLDQDMNILDKELDKLISQIGHAKEMAEKSKRDKNQGEKNQGEEIQDEKIPEGESDEDGEEKELVRNREKEEIIPEYGLYELTDENFESFLSTGRHFVKFFAPWCGHCQRLEPTWLKLASRLQDEPGVSISRIDCDQYKDACNKYGIKGYPTLLWILDGIRIHKYDGARQVDQLESYVRNKIHEDLKSDTPRTQDLILQVTDRNFKSTISQGMILIQFWAPWCAHCKRLVPVYESLANRLREEQEESIKNGSKEEKLVLGMMDCSKYDSLCSREGVDGYPTLFLYSNGRQISEYEGERTVDSIFKFLVDQVKNELDSSFKDEL